MTTRSHHAQQRAGTRALAPTERSGRRSVSGKKPGTFNNDGIEGLAKDKPVVYKIEDAEGNNIYTGSAKKGRVEERLKEHLPGAKDAIPGGKRVVITQKSS